MSNNGKNEMTNSNVIEIMTESDLRGESESMQKIDKPKLF